MFTMVTMKNVGHCPRQTGRSLFVSFEQGFTNYGYLVKVTIKVNFFDLLYRRLIPIE